ncbi:MAG TPA: hypothetical protein VFN67_24185 [Polyangiales bacterium]|nr:hypothetical protein [Polyangiales bacterium]
MAAAPFECPVPQDAPLPKLEALQSIRERGRQGALIELHDEGFVPALRPCSESGSDACNAALWERSILNTRALLS